jgi:hypothetical protein
VYQSILTNNLPNLLEYGNITALTNLWYSGQITNFEYLTHLNKHAGRSFNDLMQYPVFPFILSDYVSETLDLNDPSIYRQVKASLSLLLPPAFVSDSLPPSLWDKCAENLVLGSLS